VAIVKQFYLDRKMCINVYHHVSTRLENGVKCSKQIH